MVSGVEEEEVQEVVNFEEEQVGDVDGQKNLWIGVSEYGETVEMM